MRPLAFDSSSPARSSLRNGICSRACRERKLGLTKIHNLLEEGKLPELGAAYDALNDAVAACYGFPVRTWREGPQTLRLLLDLNHTLSPRS